MLQKEIWKLYKEMHGLLVLLTKYPTPIVYILCLWSKLGETLFANVTKVIF